jgi:hypothetical protein
MTLSEVETLFDRRRVERVRAVALPVEWHPRQSPGDGDRVPHPDEAPVRFGKALGHGHVVGRQIPKPVEISAVRIRPMDIETVAVGARECPGDGRGPVGAARDEERRADRDGGRKPKPVQAGIPLARFGSRSVSVESGTVKSQMDEAWQAAVASPCILWAAESTGQALADQATSWRVTFTNAERGSRAVT